MESASKTRRRRLSGVQSEMFLSFLARLLVWGLLFGIVLLLRSFFLLMLLTFMFAYIQAHVVTLLKPYLRSRILRVVLVGVLFLAVWAGLGTFIAPIVREQSRLVAKNYQEYLLTLDKTLIEQSRESRLLGLVLGPVQEQNGLPPASAEVWDPRHSPIVALLESLFGTGDVANGADSLKYAAEVITNIGGKILAVASAFLLSLLFSFLIVLDLPRLTRSVTSLAHTKIAFIYNEVAPSIAAFGRELGHAFQAQIIIAIFNTLFTAIGLWVLGMTSNTAFLLMIVFVCSFVPIAGVFISSTPICLIALQQGGFSLVLMAIVLIIVIHHIEAYVLNPRIYGQHLHMNPVLVLVILTIGGKLFGVWGLILGIPICTYVFREAIQYHPGKGQAPAPDGAEAPG